MEFCAIIPDRNDRPELTAFCLRQLERQTVKPAHVIHVNYFPTSERFDLTDRVYKGVQLAFSYKMDWAFIVENDDFYPADYFEKILPLTSNNDFTGCDTTVYFNLKNRTYNTFDHKYRSSLFTTGFRLAALDKFPWPKDHSPFLDIKFWQYARQKRKKFIDAGAIGIKTGLGLCGGKGHRMKFKNEDPDLKWLSERIDNESLEFYKSLAL